MRKTDNSHIHYNEYLNTWEEQSTQHESHTSVAPWTACQRGWDSIFDARVQSQTGGLDETEDFGGQRPGYSFKYALLMTSVSFNSSEVPWAITSPF
jgi:hypothetical protein